MESFGARSVTPILPGISSSEFTDLSTLRQQKPKDMETGQWVVYAGNPDSYQNLEVLPMAMDCLPGIGLVMVLNFGYPSVAEKKTVLFSEYKRRFHGSSSNHCQVHDIADSKGSLRWFSDEITQIIHSWMCDIGVRG